METACRQPVGERPPKSANILIAEDQETDVYLMKWALEKGGFPHRLVHVLDGQLVIDYLSGNAPYEDRQANPWPDLLLLDLKMPRLTGFDVLAWLQTNPLPDKFPVVVLTSSDLPADRQKASALGASDYRVKPSELEAMLCLVEELHGQWLSERAAAT